MSDRTQRRAARLGRLYPRQWRHRYPDFIETLADELVDHPRGVTRDVVRGATIERLRAAGILPACPADRTRSGIALVYASLLPFVGLSAGMWSQLRTATDRHGSTFPVMRSSGLLLAVGTAVALASLAVGVPMVVSRARRRRSKTPAVTPSGALGPLFVLASAIAVLTAAGWAADASGWYSPAAAALPSGGLGHLLTLWARAIVAMITPAWIHPSLFGRMPPGELLATLASPIAVLAAGTALFRLIVRLPVPTPHRILAATTITAVGAMFLSAAATARWLLVDPLQAGTTASVACRLPVPRDHLVASNMGPPRVHTGRLAR